MTIAVLSADGVGEIENGRGGLTFLPQQFLLYDFVPFGEPVGGLSVICDSEGRMEHFRHQARWGIDRKRPGNPS